MRWIIQGIGILIIALFLHHPACAQQELTSYENQQLGIKLTGPHGWHIIGGTDLEKIAQGRTETLYKSGPIVESVKRIGILVGFFRYPIDTETAANPNILIKTLELDPAHNPWKNRAKYIADFRKNLPYILAQSAYNIKIIQQPRITTIAKKEMLHFMYEGTAPNSIRLKSSVYKWEANNIQYTLSFMDSIDTFNQNLDAFNYSLNTLKLD